MGSPMFPAMPSRSTAPRLPDRSGIAPHQLPEDLGCSVVTGRNDVTVDTEQDGRVMSEPPGDEPGVDACGDELGGREVPEVVETNVG